MRDLIGLLPKINITLSPPGSDSAQASATGSPPAPGPASDPAQASATGSPPAPAQATATASATDPATAQGSAPAQGPDSSEEEKEKPITVSSISELWQNIYEIQKEEENNKKSKDSAIVINESTSQESKTNDEKEEEEKKRRKIKSFIVNDNQDTKVVNLYKIGDSLAVGFTTTANNNKKQESEPSITKQDVKDNLKDKFLKEKNYLEKDRHYDKIAALKYNFSEDVDVLFSDSQYQEKEGEKARKVIDVVMKEDAYFNVAYISLPNGYRAKAIMGRGEEEYIDGEKKYLEKGQVYLCDKLEKKNDKGVFQTVNSAEAKKIKEDHDIRVIGVRVKESSQAQEIKQDSAISTSSENIRRNSLDDAQINTEQNQRRGSVDGIQASDVEQNQRRGSVDGLNSLTSNQVSESSQIQPSGQAPESSQTVEITSMSIRCRGKTIEQKSEREKSKPSTIIRPTSKQKPLSEMEMALFSPV